MLELLLTRDPDDVNLLFNLGIALSEARRLAEAEDHLNRAVELAPDFADALVALGVAQLRQQDVETAIETLERAIAIEPDNPWAHRNLGIAYLRLGEDPEVAVEHLQRAVERQAADQRAGWRWGTPTPSRTGARWRNKPTSGRSRSIPTTTWPKSRGRRARNWHSPTFKAPGRRRGGHGCTDQHADGRAHVGLLHVAVVSRWVRFLARRVETVV